MTPVVSVSRLAKTYGATAALREVSLDIDAGEVLGLIGTNGAGKSTLIKILSGAVRPTGGEVAIGGSPVEFTGPLQAQRLGVQTVHQHVDDGVIAGATVAENLTLDALAPGRSGWFTSAARTRRAAAPIAAALGLDVPLDAPVESLPPGRRQQLVLARVLARRPKLLILDEPTSALSAAETRVLLDTVRGLAATGVAVLYITHRLAEIQDLCDRVAVLRDGVIRRIFDVPVEGSLLVETMLGEPADAHAYDARTGGAPVLVARGIRTGPEAAPFDLNLGEGEIVGLTGLVGSGKTELLEQLYGERPLVSGSLTLNGSAYAPAGPHRAVAAGVALVAEERESQAIVPAWSVRAHVALPRLRAILSRTTEIAAARRVIAELEVNAEGPEAEIETLSGGNQQKVLVGRWLDEQVRLLLLDEPFRGVDVGARATIARALRDRGVTALVACADPQELRQVADRVLVLHDGELTGELPVQDATPARLAPLMAGVAA
jgi:simple sugar transport system ATP-binding protein